MTISHNVVYLYPGRDQSDLTEGGSELMSGFNVKYTVGSFTLFLIAEYANIIVINIFTTILFLGAFHNPYIPELYIINFFTVSIIKTSIQITIALHKIRNILIPLLSMRSYIRHFTSIQLNPINMTKTCTHICAVPNFIIN
ncbi:hypothetical protein Celaphus_00001122 [Cervus elaphus hippelaphus]|uniref:NADH-ubiquinone oxidoreductase chain 1 n=1 Tax=Cervus elaphus hippelaphus TaxID=46360 RepID=A0A212D7M3_CEREH|nr:hypothetical protein Celaphus_00001122 [Cervus elaphus hippelaphus]